MPSLKISIAAAGLAVYIAHRHFWLKDASLLTLGSHWLLAFLIPSAIYALYKFYIGPRFFSPYKSLPAPTEKPHWLYGHIPYFNTDLPAAKPTQWVNQVNDSSPFFRYNGFLNKERLLIISHGALHAVLQSHSYEFIKPSFTRRYLAKIVGDGILNAEYDYHKRQRKLLNPAFAFGHIKSLVPIFVLKSINLSNVIATLIESPTAKVEDDGSVIINVEPLAHATTLDIIFEAGFGVEFDALENKDNELLKAYHKLFEAPELSTWRLLETVLTMSLGHNIVRTKRNKEIDQAVKVVHKFADDLIEEKLQKQKIAKTFGKTNAEKDILNILIQEGQGSWTREEIKNNLLTFFAAGHETTSGATAIAVYLLSKNKEVQNRLRDEIRAHTSISADFNEDNLRSLTYDKIETLKYLNNVSREILRFIPPVPLTIREATKDIVVEGVLVRKGTELIIAAGAINRSKKFWGPDAEEFNPDRWDNLPTLATSPYSFLTFLQGPRSCIGRRFAELEFKALLIALVSRFEFDEVESGKDFKLTNFVTSKFVNGVPVKVKLAR
ncbi:cytochrome P450 [Lipomyces japonicus]|uniref:cytochrome P450 n=1 Tax=Lipomyces japonicus TaxID=56871 RepID=UPI0034CE7ABB